jgi:hypothetical protein
MHVKYIQSQGKDINTCEMRHIKISLFKLTNFYNKEKVMKCLICGKNNGQEVLESTYENNLCDDCLWELAPDVDTYFLTKMNQKEKEKNHEKK